jgi:small subunit ribosomal protein S9
MSIELYSGLGKRKTSVAKVYLKEGSGIIKINEKSVEDFFAGAAEDRDMIKTPLILLNMTNKYDVVVKVRGGGVSSQLDAIKLAIAKAFSSLNSEYRKILSKNSLLRRDSRIKERRKYGLRKARKAPQYSKR